MKKITSFILMLIFILSFNLKAYALKEETHEAINQEVAKRTINGFSLNSYLKNNLGFQKGVEEPLYGYSEIKKKYDKQEVFIWLGEGGVQEDRPGSNTDYITGRPSRSVNHFHNPLKTNWDEAGLNDTFLGKSYTGQSSVLWAQNPNQNIGGKWSWQDVREYFYIALIGKDFTGNNVTPLPGETEEEKRERYFTNTFRGIGQQMHLIEDASVPAHVRNDIHIPNPLYPHYEQKVEAFRTKQNIYGTFWNDLLANPITYDKSILNITSTHPSAPVPISRIIDTDLYNGGNPGVTTTLFGSPQNIGIAEYTNANFLSKDTLFTHFDFNYPNISDTVLWIDNNNREYIRKVGKGDTINHLAVSSWLYPFRIMYFPQYTEYLPVGLDEECYKEYATKLIPRAVGYSAGLLDYFFRGTLEITAPDSYIYSITDGSITPQQFTRLKAKVRNSTPDTMPNEEIQGCDAVKQNCIIQAVARYKKRTDYQPDLSTDPPTASSRETDYSYSVSAPIVITSLSSTTPAEFTFDFTNSPIPAGITDLYLHVVFKGTIGSETDIAMAVGMKDLNEPQHFSIWNATDRFYLDGVLRTASEIRNDPSLLARVDFNGNGIANEAGEPYIDPYDVTTEIAFYPSGVTPTIYNATFTPLPSGRYGRIIILTDMPNFYTLIHRNSTNPPDDMTANFLFSGVTNQDINGTFQNTQVITFRGIIQHTWSAYARNYPNATGISTAPWPVPVNTNPYPATTLYP